MSFIAIAPAAANTSPDPLIIENDGWFPDIDLTHMRDAMRLDGTVTDERLAQAIIIAVLNINDELGDWQKEKQVAGCLTMMEVPASTVNRSSAAP